MDKIKHEGSDHDGEGEAYAEEAGKKIKISPLRSCEVEADEAVSVENTAPKTRECNICGKTFSNGKALGGHRRFHFQEARKYPHKVKTLLLKKVINNRASSDGKHKCSICNKEFTSKNALFGHMRSHPKDKKGLCPPSSSSHNSDSSVEQNDKEDQDHGKVVAPDEHRFIDLSKSNPPSWQKKDKRGRKCIGGYEAAKNLMYIYAELYSCHDVSKKRTSTAVEPKSPQVSIPAKKRKIIGESSSSEVKKIKFVFGGSFKFGENSERDGDCDDSDKLNSKKHDVNESPGKIKIEAANPGAEVKKVRKGKKSKKDSVYENETQEKSGAYKCGICSKSFSTFQGLGGHRSVHKQKNIETMNEENQPNIAAVAEEINSSGSSNVPKVDETETPLSEETLTLTDEASQSTGPTKLDFDLNEPYVMEEN
ncbi:Zinc finger C2H2-type [Sesbania bispinosa]|nr:Zinc finger C2H2-type [Sesbania bispinosa]